MSDLELELSLSAKKALQDADALQKKVQQKFTAKPIEMEMRFKSDDDKAIRKKVLANRIALLAEMQREQDRALKQQQAAEAKNQKQIQAQWQRVMRNRIRLVAQYQKEQEKQRLLEEDRANDIRLKKEKELAISSGRFRIAELKKMLRQADTEEGRFIGRQIARQKRAAREAAVAARQAISERMVQSGRAAFADDVNFGPAAGRGRGSSRRTPPPLPNQAEFIRGQNVLAKRSGRASLVAFQLQQAVEDFSYAGIRGASNNIALIAAQLGGKGGLIALGGLAAVAIGGMAFAMSGLAESTRKAAEEQRRLADRFIDVSKAQIEVRRAMQLGFGDIAGDPTLNLGPAELRQSGLQRTALGTLIGSDKGGAFRRDIQGLFRGVGFTKKIVKSSIFGRGGVRTELNLGDVDRLRPLLSSLPEGASLLKETESLRNLEERRRALRARQHRLRGRSSVDPLDGGGFLGLRRFGAAGSRKLFGGAEEGGAVPPDLSDQILHLDKQIKELGEKATVSEAKIKEMLLSLSKNSELAAKKLAKVASEDVRVFETLKKFIKPDTLKGIETQVAIQKKIEESLTGRQITSFALGEAEDKTTRLLELQLERKIKQYELDRKRVTTLKELTQLEAKFRQDISPIVDQINILRRYEEMVKEQKQKQLSLLRDQVSEQKNLISEKDSEIRKNQQLIKHTQQIANRSGDRFSHDVLGVQEQQAGAFARIQNIRQKVAFRRSLDPRLAFLGPNGSVLNNVLGRGDAAIDMRTSVQGELIRRQFLERHGAMLTGQASAAGRSGNRERQAEILRELQRAQLAEAGHSAQQGFLGRSQAALGAAGRTQTQIQSLLRSQISSAQAAMQAAQGQKSAAQMQLKAVQSRLKSVQMQENSTVRFMAAVGQFAAAVSRITTFSIGQPAERGAMPFGLGNMLNFGMLGGAIGGLDPGILFKGQRVPQLALPVQAPAGPPIAPPQNMGNWFIEGMKGLWGQLGFNGGVVNNNQQFVFSGLQSGGNSVAGGIAAAVAAQQRMNFLRMGMQG